MNCVYDLTFDLSNGDVFHHHSPTLLCTMRFSRRSLPARALSLSPTRYGLVFCLLLLGSSLHSTVYSFQSTSVARRSRQQCQSSPSRIKLSAKPPLIQEDRLDATKPLPITANADDIEEDDEIPSSVLFPLILLLTSQFLLFLGVGAVIPSIPLYGKEIGLSSAANGIVISAPAVALLLTANWGGQQADRARKPAMMIGMAIIAVSDIGTAVATTLPMLIAARLGLGWGRALSEAGERGMLVDLANRIPSLRGRALAAQQAIVALGITIGAPSGGLVVERYGPRAAFLCVSAAAIVALILYSFLPETVAAASDDDDATDEEEDFMAGPKIWLELLRQQQWRGLALCQSGASFGFAAKIASIPILAAAALPGGAAGAGALLSAAGVSGLIGAPLGGWSTDQFGAKWTTAMSGFISSLGLILVPVALSTDLSSSPLDENLSLGNITLGSNALFFSLAVMLWSLGATAQGPALTALAQQYTKPGAEATSLSLVKAAGDGTYIIVPFLLGLVSDAFLDIKGAECALAGTAILLGTLALAALVPDPNQLQTKEV